MKALTIQPARGSQRAEFRAILRAAVSTPSAQRALLSVAIAATVCLFACLGLMHVPGILLSGLVSLSCTALATSSKEGGDA